eukprot:TRINITY_DN7011_c0_g1_i1.p1 TRINITY_DN7011_c0_g1~~TRINITY_DN7011_c0_g1_i1.p1  ORF type:complete len:605 (+),score=238.41 TRINITY_DN7011_c0_g1_i1:38-1852(+)
MYSWAEEDEEDEEEVLEDKFGGKNLTIFLVDGTKGMSEQVEGDTEGLTGIQLALSCVHATIKSKIFHGDKDCVGLLTFGNKEAVTKGSDFPTVRQVLSLARPSGEAILMLEELMDGQTGAALFESRFGCGVEGDVKLHEALWQCQSMFSTIPGKVATKTIILMTNNPSPHGGDSRLDLQARRKAGDLHGTDIFLDVVPVCGEGQQFQMDKFYCDLIKLADDSAPVTTTSLADLTNTVVKRTSVKRSTGKMQFLVGGVTIAVSAYNLVSKSSKPAKQKLASDTNEAVVTCRTWTHPITGAPLLPSDMNRFQKYGGKNISFTEDEVKNINSLGSEQLPLKLCGFKPISSLKPSHHVRGPQFLQPLETSVQGSRSVFSALLSRCLARKVMAVCQYKPRRTTGLTYIGLLPQEEEVDEAGTQMKPPGFHVIFLPFIDDIRRLPLPKLPQENPPEAVEAAKEVIKKLRLKQFVPVENCSLQNHYQMIEAHALRRDTLIKPEDQTVPDVDRMIRKLGDRSGEFLINVYEEGYDPEAPPKKKAATAAAKVKVEKKTVTMDNVAEMDMKTMVMSGSVGKLTVDVLKTWLKSKGVVVGKQKKGELVDLVMAEF